MNNFGYAQKGNGFNGPDESHVPDTLYIQDIENWSGAYNYRCQFDGHMDNLVRKNEHRVDMLPLDYDGWMKIVFQPVGDRVEVVVVPKLPHLDFASFEKDGIDPGAEFHRCWWNTGRPVSSLEIPSPFCKIGEWHMSAPGKTYLVWWDHDLGDVVVDRLNPADGEFEDDYDLITDDVYFYWIT